MDPVQNQSVRVLIFADDRSTLLCTLTQLTFQIFRFFVVWQLQGSQRLDPTVGVLPAIPNEGRLAVIKRL